MKRNVSRIIVNEEFAASQGIKGKHCKIVCINYIHFRVPRAIIVPLKNATAN